MATPPGAPRPPLARRLTYLRRLGTAFHALSTGSAVAIAALSIALFAVLAIDAEASISHFGWAFLAGRSWDLSTDSFGALPAVVGTLLTSALALTLAVPVALAVAIFSSEIAPTWARGPLAILLDVGATIPSIVYGFWALLVIVPLMRTTVEPALARATGGVGPFSGTPLGSDVLTASVVLAIMVIPTIAALSREAMRLVPRAQREGALALGANRWEAARLAVLGPVRPALLGAVLVGLGRAIGETVAVSLVIGNIYALPSSLLSPGQTIPSLIVGVFGGSLGLQLSALFELGLILFVISLVVNLAARLLMRRVGRPAPPRRISTAAPPRTERSPSRHGGPGRAPSARANAPARPRRSVPMGRRAGYVVVLVLLLLAVVVAVAPLAGIVETAVARGGAAVVRPSFYTSQLPPACISTTSANCTLGGIGPAIEGTALLLGLASLVALPVGLLGGIYLSEYGRHAIGRSIGLVIDVLVGVPSILIGVFVFAVFLQFDPLDPLNAFAGAMALGLLMVPLVVRATASALETVPSSVREAGLALGFPRHRVTLRVVLGSAKSAIVTGVLLAVGRAGGETAALLVTAGYSTYWFSGFDHPTVTLAAFIYNTLTVSDYPNWQTDAWGAALVLLLMMVALSLLARSSLKGGAAAELA